MNRRRWQIAAAFLVCLIGAAVVQAGPPDENPSLPASPDPGISEPPAATPSRTRSREQERIEKVDPGAWLDHFGEVEKRRRDPPIEHR